MSAALELLGELLEADRAAAEALGQPDRPVVAAVGDEHRLHAAGGKRPGGELGRLACADHEDAPAREVAERPLGELDRHRGDRQRALR